MIEILLSKINKITKKAINSANTATTSIFGDGELGNAFYGNSASVVPAGFDIVSTPEDGVSYIPYNTKLSYNNLIIDKNCVLKALFTQNYVTICVKDTLTLRGTISLANTQPLSEPASYSSNLVIGSAYLRVGGTFFTPTYITLYTPLADAAINILGEQSFLPNTNFCYTGGYYIDTTTNTAYSTGGCFCAYYAYLENENGVDLGKNFMSSVNIAGQKLTASTNLGGGGCLLLSAKRIVLDVGGAFDVHGGDGTDTSALGSGIFLNYKV